MDLFETPELLPAEVQTILENYSHKDNSYENCQALELDLLNVGYSIEWGLDAIPCDLKKID